MRTKLPEPIHQEIQYHLRNNDPESAKLVYDQWMMKHHHAKPQEKLVCSSVDDDHVELF